MTGSDQTAALRSELSDEAQRIFINAEYTGRQHMYAGQDWRIRATKIGLPVAILTASVGSGAAGVAALFGWDPRITVVFGFAGAIAGAIRLFFKADDQAAAHSTKGARYIAIAGEARRFRKIDLNSDAEIAGLVKELRDLAGRLDALREGSLGNSPKASTRRSRLTSRTATTTTRTIRSGSTTKRGSNMATTVLKGFDELLANLTLSATEAATAAGRVRNLQNIFCARYTCARAPWTIGSYGRETLIRWQRDIDMMVALDDAYWPSFRADSRQFLYTIHNFLNEQYGQTEVSTKQVAVRMVLSGGLQVDLVPTFVNDTGGFLMPDGRGGWQRTNPPYHDKLMSDSNVRLSSRLKPLVRFMKAWNYVNGRHLRSFHLETIVERMWRDASALPSVPDAMAKTLETAVSWVETSFADPWTGSGLMLDSYLTTAQRDQAVRLLKEDAARAKVALDLAASGEIVQAFDRWNVVYGKYFPAYG